MRSTHRRWILISIMLVLCIGIIGAGYGFGPRGIVGFIQAQIEDLDKSVGDLSELSLEHDEQIQLIVSHIRDMKASLCEIHDTEPRPAFCSSTCVPGICDTDLPPHPCDANPELCDDDGG